MPSEFDGIRLKLKRAWNQLDGLKAEIDSFLKAGPYEPKVDFYGKSKIIVVSVNVISAPVAMWSIQVGEIIHNLRSALDHLVHELVILNTGNPPVAGSKNQFPIFDTEAGFRTRGIPSQLRGVSQDAIKLIRAEQSFPQADGGTGEDIGSPLLHLRELSNADKHRTIHLTGALLESYKFTFAPLIMRCKNVQRWNAKAGPIKQNTVLAKLTSPDFTRWPFQNNQVNGELKINVAFDEATPAVGGWLVWGTLIDIANRTERIAAKIATEVFGGEL